MFTTQTTSLIYQFQLQKNVQLFFMIFLPTMTDHFQTSDFSFATLLLHFKLSSSNRQAYWIKSGRKHTKNACAFLIDMDSMADASKSHFYPLSPHTCNFPLTGPHWSMKLIFVPTWNQLTGPILGRNHVKNMNILLACVTEYAWKLDKWQYLV